MKVRKSRPEVTSHEYLSDLEKDNIEIPMQSPTTFFYKQPWFLPMTILLVILLWLQLSPSKYVLFHFRSVVFVVS
jgi:hypothetical protein